MTWEERHIRFFRTRPGHDCTLPGCTGSQPLVWVKTQAEVWAESRPYRSQVIDWHPSSPLFAYIRKMWPSNFR